MVDIRLMGTQDEIAGALDALRRGPFRITEEATDFYPNRRSASRGRVYVKVEPLARIVRAQVVRLDRPELEA